MKKPATDPQIFWLLPKQPAVCNLLFGRTRTGFWFSAYTEIAQKDGCFCANPIFAAVHFANVRSQHISTKYFSCFYDKCRHAPAHPRKRICELSRGMRYSSFSVFSCSIYTAVQGGISIFYFHMYCLISCCVIFTRFWEHLCFQKGYEGVTWFFQAYFLYFSFSRWIWLHIIWRAI